MPERLVIDTNTVLDWLVFREPPARELGSLIAAGRLRWLASPRMLAELRAVLSRPLAARWNASREHALTIDVSQWATVCDEPTVTWHALVCRDPDDQVFIDLACAHRPAVLLTRDHSLLALRRRAATLGVVVATARSWRAWPTADPAFTTSTPST